MDAVSHDVWFDAAAAAIVCLYVAVFDVFHLKFNPIHLWERERGHVTYSKNYISIRLNSSKSIQTRWVIVRRVDVSFPFIIIKNLVHILLLSLLLV